MTSAQIEWLLLAVNNAPISNTADVRNKAHWLQTVAQMLETAEAREKAAAEQAAAQTAAQTPATDSPAAAEPPGKPKSKG